MDRKEEILRDKLKVDKAVGFGKLMWDKHKDTLIECMELYKNESPLLSEALRLLRDLAEFQNGAPLIQYEEDYNKTMEEVWIFLDKNEN